jgi:hypothetical protein
VGRYLQQQNCERHEGCIGKMEGCSKHTGIGRDDLSFRATAFSAECPTAVAATYSMSNILMGGISNIAPSNGTHHTYRNALIVMACVWMKADARQGTQSAHIANRRGIERRREPRRLGRR